MDKLFEIPIYAMDKDTLMKRYEDFCKKFRQENIPLDASEDVIRRCIEIETYPQRLWQYNHLVGYIMVGIDGYDIEFKVYLATPRIDKYYWKSKRKKFFYDIGANGAHFRLESKNTNREIQSEISNTLDSIIREHIPDKYYVDLECFKQLNQFVDYEAVVGKKV